MEQLQCIYDDLKDNNEIAIIDRYGVNAKHYTIMFTSRTIFLFFILFHTFNRLINLRFYNKKEVLNWAKHHNFRLNLNT